VHLEEALDRFDPRRLERTLYSSELSIAQALDQRLAS
jgi:hypothetical protein